MELNKVVLNFNKEELELIKSNSELLMNDLSKSTESVETKANILFGFLVLLIGSCLGIFVNKYPNIDYSDLIIHEILLVCFITFLSLRQTYKVLELKEYKLIGTTPDFHINYEDYENTDKIKEILKDTLTTYQSIIDKNTEVHNLKVNHMQKAIEYTMTGVIITFIYAVLYVMFNFLFLQQ